MTNLSAFISVRFGRPCLDLCNFRIQDFLLCCQAGSCLLEYGDSLRWCGLSTSLSFLCRTKKSAKLFTQKTSRGQRQIAIQRGRKAGVPDLLSLLLLLQSCTVQSSSNSEPASERSHDERTNLQRFRCDRIGHVRITPVKFWGKESF